jgi:integrase
LLARKRKSPNGEDFGLEDHVFGNAVGERLDSVKTAWRATCRRAGVADLHFHDLRREAACRWFEAGVPLHHIRDLLGHAGYQHHEPLPVRAATVDGTGRAST